MKRKLILLALLFANLIGYSQYYSNGMPISLNKPHSNEFFLAKTDIPSIEFPFDSVRPLSELNRNFRGEALPWISNDGKTLYYTRDESPYDRLVKTTRVHIDSLFSEPVELAVNVEGQNNFSPWLTSDQLHIFFMHRAPNDPFTTTLYHASRSSANEPFGDPVAVTLTVTGLNFGFITGPSLTQDLEQLYLSNRGRILVFEKVSDDEYVLVDKIIPPNDLESPGGKLSPDGLRYYLSLKSSGSFNNRLYVSERASLSSSFFNVFLLDNEMLTEGPLRSIQPSISADGNFFAFTRAEFDEFGETDLYIAQNTPDPADTTNCTNPFPPVEESSLNTTFQGNGYLLEWNPVPNQLGCQVAVRFAGGNLIDQQIVNGENAESLFVPGGFLQFDTDYEWRVRCGCSQTPLVAGPWSSWQFFSSPIESGISTNPNPTSGQSFVSFTASEEGYTTLEVYDMSGRLVESIFAGAVQPDAEYRFEFDGSALPNGVYLYRLTTSEEVVTEKFMISK